MPLRSFPWTLCLIVLGLALRLYHYLVNPSMWHDEAALVLNVLRKSFAELLGPLLFSEAAPPLFLWIEKGVILALGDSTFALRLVPFLASCTALVLLVPLARRLLDPAAVPWAVLFFACSDQLLWHASEAKSYALDVLAAVVVAVLFVTTRAWRPTGRFILFAGLAPVVIFLSYPGCFLYGGVLLALLPIVCRARRWTAWLGYGLLTTTVFASFVLLVLGPARAQRDTAMMSCWLECFPNWQRPWTVPLWTLLSTLEVARYCCEPVGQVLVPLAVAGAVGWWRRGQRAELLLLLVPVALAWVASCVRAYPYAGARILVYASPALLLLLAESVPPLLTWLQARSRLAMVAVFLVFLAPAARVAQHLVVPRVRADCVGAAEYVLSHRQPADLVTANHWEYEYYFRHLGDAFAAQATALTPLSDRIWLVLTDADMEDRLQLGQQLCPAGWHAAQMKHFTRTTVFLLEK